MIDLAPAHEFLLELLPRAGEVLKGYFLSGNFTSTGKKGLDFKTQADDAVDVLLRQNISAKYPDIPILSEETASDDYFLLKNSEYLWVIDPLDGTTNFSRGNPRFAISVALVARGLPKLGVIHLPVSGDIYYVQAGSGPALLNGKKIGVSSTKKLREAVLACDWSWDTEKRLELVRWLGSLAGCVRQIKSMGCAVADLASLARGEIDAYLHSGLKPWDVAAAALLIQEAGGKVTTSTGGAWDVFQPDLLAANSVLHNIICEVLNNG